MSAPTAYRPPVFTNEIDIDLSKNEGVSSPRLDALLDLDISRYPDTRRLRRLIADLSGTDETKVLITAGGDDGLARAFQMVAGGTVVASTPSFEMIPRYAAQNRSPLVEVPWWDGPFPTEEFTAVEADLAVVVSPNNPTGSTITPEVLRRIAASFPITILDAAYEEFCSVPLTNLALDLANVVVVRTLSKAYGLAGLRVGYLLGPQDLIATLSSFGSPYAVSAPSLRVAEARLEDPSTDVAATTSRRQRLTEVLDGLAVDHLRSEANFVLLRNVDADALSAALAALGVGVRAFPDRPEMEGCLRITVPRDDHEFDRLQSALETVLSPQAVLFDLDGVIVDVSNSYRKAILDTAASFGVVATSDDVEQIKAEGNANDDWELTRLICERNGRDLALEEVTEVFEEIYQGTGDQPGLKENESLLVSSETLSRIASTVPIGIVTGRPRKDALEVLERLAVATLFSTVITREDAPMKPDPTPVKKAMAELGVSRAWMAGDTRDDLEAARGAGALPIAVGPTPLRPAAALLDNASQLEGMLNDTLR